MTQKAILEAIKKVATHTSNGKKRKATESSNKNLQQKLLIHQTLPIITMTIDPWIMDRVTTCGWNPHALKRPTTKVAITKAAHSIVHQRTSSLDSMACKQDGQG